MEAKRRCSQLLTVNKLKKSTIQSLNFFNISYPFSYKLATSLVKVLLIRLFH